MAAELESTSATKNRFHSIHWSAVTVFVGKFAPDVSKLAAEYGLCLIKWVLESKFAPGIRREMGTGCILRSARSWISRVFCMC